MQYLLQNKIIFDSDNGCLNTEDSEQIVKLPYPAKLLLEFFCQNAQLLISRDELIDKAWGKNGLQGSGSNLYNCLSAIRKGISTLGVEQQAIRTQPKVGFTFQLTVTVIELKAETGPDSSSVALVEDDPQVNNLSPPERIANRQRDENGASASVKSISLTSLCQRLRLTGLANPNYYFFWPLFITLLLIITQTSHNKGGILPASYDLMANDGQCSLFRLDPLTDIYPELSPDKKISRLAATHNVNCHLNKVNFYIYSSGMVHEVNDVFNVLIAMCIYDDKNSQSTSCFNDYSILTVQHEN